MELFFFCFLVCLCIMCGINESRHKKSNDALVDAFTSMATKCADLEHRLGELEEKFNELENGNAEFADFEKRWQDGIQGIMDYSLDKAMRGVMNG